MRSLAIFLFSCLLLLAGCGRKTTTVVTGTWADPAYQTGQVHKLLVVGVGAKEQARKAFERELRDRLNKRKNTEAMASLEVLTVNEEISRATFEKYFADKGIDAVIVAEVVEVTDAASYKEGDKYGMVDPNYDGFYSYYTRKIVKVPDPGGFEYGRMGRIETNAFETREGKHIWHCVTRSFDQGNTLDVIDDLAKLIVENLKQDRIIR